MISAQKAKELSAVRSREIQLEDASRIEDEISKSIVLKVEHGCNSFTLLLNPWDNDTFVAIIKPQLIEAGYDVKKSTRWAYTHTISW